MSQQQKNLVLLLGAAVLAGALGLYAYYGVQLPQQAEEKRKAETGKLFSLGEEKKARDGGSADPVFTKLTVTAKGETTVLEKQDDGWQIVSPVHAGADKFAVDSVVSQLTTGKIKDTVEENPTPQDLEKYGLKSPRFTVTAQAHLPGQPDRTLVLKGGVENTFDGSIYIQREGDPKVYQAQGGLRWSVEKSTFDLRDKEVLAVDEKAVNRIDVAGTRPFVAVKDGQKWKLEKPQPMDADAQQITAMLGALRNEKAVSFLDDGADARHKAGVDKPLVKVTLSQQQGDPVEIALGKVGEPGKEKYYARRTGGGQTVLAELSQNAVALLDKGPDEVRDRAVLAFDKDAVKRVWFQKKGQPKIEVRLAEASDGGTKDDWKVVSPMQGPAKKWKVSSILWSLGALKAAAFDEQAPKSWQKYGLGDPEQTIGLEDGTGKLLAKLEVGAPAPAKDNIHYVRGTRDQVLEMDVSRLSDLPTRADDLIDAGPAHPPSLPPIDAPGPTSSK